MISFSDFFGLVPVSRSDGEPAWETNSYESPLSLDPTKCAIVSIDMGQRSTTDPLPPRYETCMNTYVAPCFTAARAAGMYVVHTPSVLSSVGVDSRIYTTGDKVFWVDEVSSIPDHALKINTYLQGLGVTTVIMGGGFAGNECYEGRPASLINLFLYSGSHPYTWFFTISDNTVCIEDISVDVSTSQPALTQVMYNSRFWTGSGNSFTISASDFIAGCA